MARKLRLDLPLVLPDVPDTADACVARLTDELERRGGVDKVHIARTANGEPQLCVHFDEDVYSLSRIREVVESCGARLTERFGHALFAVDGIAHQRRARTVVALCERRRVSWMSRRMLPALYTLNSTDRKRMSARCAGP